MIKKIKHFKLLTPQGKVFDSKKYQGKSNLLIVFYRGVWCNFCKRQIIDFGNNYKEFKKLNIKIVAISNDNQLNTSLLSVLIKSKFPLLFDAKNEVLKKYRIKIEKKVARPTVYLFSNSGKIMYRYVSADYQDRLSAEKLLKIIKRRI